MNRELEIGSITSLLDREGLLAVQGWARKPLFAYNRDRLAKNARITERECFHIVNNAKGYEIALIFQDEPSRSIHSIIYTDTNAKKCSETTMVTAFPKGRCKLSADSREDAFTTFQDKDNTLVMTAIRKKERIYIVFNAPSLPLPDGRIGLLADLAIDARAWDDCITAASGVDGVKKGFHLAERHLPLPVVDGFVRRGQDKDMLAEDGALALTDSVRRRAVKEEPLYNAFALSTELSFTLGYGCEKLMSAVFIGHRLAKLGQIDFNLHSDLMKPWVLREDAGLFEADFVPSFVQRLDSYSKLEVIGGLFSGNAYDEDGGKFTFSRLQGTVLRHRT